MAHNLSQRSSKHFVNEAEQMVRTFKTAIKKNISNALQWDEALNVLLTTYRNTPNNSGKSPAEILHGRRHRSTLPAMLPSQHNNLTSKSNTTFKNVRFSTNEPVFALQYQNKPKWVERKVIKNLGPTYTQIRDRVVMGIAEQNIRLQLLKTDALNLAKAKELCRVAEQVSMQSQQMQAEQPSVAAISKKKRTTAEL